MGNPEALNPGLIRTTLLYLDTKSVAYAEIQSCGARCVRFSDIVTSLSISEVYDLLLLVLWNSVVISLVVKDVKLEFAMYMYGALTEKVE